MRNRTIQELQSVATVTYRDATHTDSALRHAHAQAHADARRRAKREHRRVRDQKRAWFLDAARGE